MEHQRVSEICFEETFYVTPAETARSIFGRLPNGADCSHGLAGCLATCFLVAVAEAACIREMKLHIDPTTEVVVGRQIDIDHREAVLSGTLMQVRGWVEAMGEHSARFFVRASDAHSVVCELHITLVAANRVALASRIASRSGKACPTP